jgi:hypothetical protein
LFGMILFLESYLTDAFDNEMQCPGKRLRPM